MYVCLYVSMYAFHMSIITSFVGENGYLLDLLRSDPGRTVLITPERKNCGK